jgi:hypothetical protein
LLENTNALKNLLFSLNFACLSAKVPDNGGNRDFSFSSTRATKVDNLFVNSLKLNSLSSSFLTGGRSSAAKILCGGA